MPAGQVERGKSTCVKVQECDGPRRSLPGVFFFCFFGLCVYWPMCILVIAWFFASFLFSSFSWPPMPAHIFNIAGGETKNPCLHMVGNPYALAGKFMADIQSRLARLQVRNTGIIEYISHGHGTVNIVSL